MGEKKRREAIERERQAESRRALERVARDSETVGSSSFARTANRLSTHFLGQENPEDDAIEVWGKRIGRTLGLIAFVGLFIYLVMTYVVPK